MALLPADPSFVHPLMDGMLYRLLRACPHLSLVLAVPTPFLAHADPAHRMSWGRRLVRRLWAGDTTLSNRIRLLPHVVDSRRLAELLRLSDFALDTFPVGGSPQNFAHALSVGTPVVCLESGVLNMTSIQDEREMRGLSRLAMEQGLGAEALPWRPAVSILSAFYRRHNFTELVASSAAEFAQIAERLATDKEYGYSLRVRLLELVDADDDASEDSEDLQDLEKLLERMAAQYAVRRESRSR